MPKLMQSIWLAPLGVAVVAGLLLADSGRPASAVPQRPTDGRAPVVVAMQETPSTAPAKQAVPDKGWVGVMLEDHQGQGARVVDVFPAGPAAFGGVRAGDVITKVGGNAVTSAAAASSAIEQVAPQQKVSITVDRRGRAIELTVPVESMNDFRGRYVHEMVHRDPRHPKYAAHPGVSESDMNAEVIRRLFEQHERLERAISDLTKEVRELREEVRALKKQ